MQIAIDPIVVTVPLGNCCYTLENHRYRQLPYLSVKPFLCRLSFHLQLLLAGADAQSILACSGFRIEEGESEKIEVILCSSESSLNP
jgi:hypothetical protein